MFEAIGGLISGLFGGNKKAKKTAQQLAIVSQKVDVLVAENAEQSKMIKWLLIGLAAVAVVVFFFVFLRKRRG